MNKNKSNTKTKLESNNVILTGYAKFKAELKAKQEKLQIEKSERKVVRTRSTHISLKNNVLLLIYLASISNGKGITVAEIMESEPVNAGKKTAYNIHTINRDWNVESHEQSETIRLEEKGIEVGFEIGLKEPKAESLKGKQNNRITAVFGIENLKSYLLESNVTEEMLKS